VLFMVMASNTISAILVTAGISNRYFNQYAQLNSD
jgi:ABC-type iron transport system FetAB permease component